MRVYSARSGRLGRGMLSGDGGRSAGHAGRAQKAKGEISPSGPTWPRELVNCPTRRGPWSFWVSRWCSFFKPFGIVITTFIHMTRLSSINCGRGGRWHERERGWVQRLESDARSVERKSGRHCEIR